MHVGKASPSPPDTTPISSSDDHATSHATGAGANGCMKSSHRKRVTESSSSMLEESLRKHGEAFMRMFDDRDEDGGEQARAGADTEVTVDGPSIPPLDGERADVADPPSRTGKKSRRKKKRKEPEVEEIPPRSRKEARRQDDLDVIFGAIGERGRADGQDGDGPSSRGKKGTGSGGRSDAVLDDQRREEERLRRKIERKRFMSSNPDAMLSFNEEAMLAEAKRRVELSREAGVVDRKTEMEEFKAIRREIQSFGATGLDRKSRAKFEQDRLLELGARKEKGVRTPAKIGTGIAKKAAWREQRSIDEAIASGMVSRKAIAEKKRREAKKRIAGEDRGLFEDRGSFDAKRGVLRLKK